MTKKKLDQYLNKTVVAELKNGETISGRIRKIKDIYVIGKDIQLKPSSVVKIEIKSTTTEVKFLKRTKIGRVGVIIKG